MGSVALRPPDRLFIDGRRISLVAGGRIDVMSPRTDEVVASVAEATAPDVAAAVAAACRAFDDSPWPQMPAESRGQPAAT